VNKPDHSHFSGFVRYRPPTPASSAHRHQMGLIRSDLVLVVLAAASTVLAATVSAAATVAPAAGREGFGSDTILGDEQ
jgi:hypothetical protein